MVTAAPLRSAKLRVPSVLLILAALLAGCGDSEERTVWERAGKAADTDVIESYQGDGHCGWDSVIFLRVSWPLGTTADSDAHMFVRDPKNVLGADTLAKYEPAAALPPSAENTGYSSESGQLWLVPGDQAPDVAYIVSDRDRVEAWPRARELLGCD